MFISLLIVILQVLASGTHFSPCVKNKMEPEEAKQSSAALQVDEFPVSSGGLRRRKREWVIPLISAPENDKGPFPKKLVQIKSSLTKEIQIIYSITGEGADQPPKGVFTVYRNTGWLYVTQPLDRETKAHYTLQAHAVGVGDSLKENPVDIIINVIDQNDNKPVFTQNPFLGSVPEALPKDFEFMTVTATDADDPDTDNADVRYSIISQDPPLPNPNMFTINPVTGGIRVNSDGLDRENYPQYTLEIMAADMQGNGLSVVGKAVITVTDSNDNAPKFEKTSYTVSVPENKAGVVVVKVPVTDGDEPQSPAWAAKFKIVGGNTDGMFNISTGPNKQEGIITTVKPLDFEKNSKYTLLVIVENEVPFAKPMTTSTATVTVNVVDVNEAPIFDPVEKIISVSEDLQVNSELTLYTATDPDTGKTQKVIYRVGSDLAGWLSVDRETGLIKLKSSMDRESPFVKDEKYKALIFAIKEDDIPTTGTGTLIINVQDVNDNTPTITNTAVSFCNSDPQPVVLSISDEDGPSYSSPFRAEIIGDSKNHWTLTMISDGKAIKLYPNHTKENRDFKIIIRVSDTACLYKDNIISVQLNEKYCLNYFCMKS